MNVNINVKPVFNWENIGSGDFIILQGTPNCPIPDGLYRIFMAEHDETHHKTLCIVPLFNGPFHVNMFPFMLEDEYPILIQKINNINIEAS